MYEENVMKKEKNTFAQKFARSINWRSFWILLAMVAIGLIAVIPYGLTLEGQTIEAATLSTLVPQFLIQTVLYSVLLWLSLKLSANVGLGLPLLNGESKEKVMKIVLLAVVLGLVVGIAMIFLDVFVFAPRLEADPAVLAASSEVVRPPVWQGFLASFYGGIVEEVMMRLFLMTLILWVGSKLSKKNKPSLFVIWFAILFAGLAFGLAHLPTIIAMGVPLSPLYIVRTLVLNSVGILYGWLYWKRGFESAMIAHFSTDLMVHVLGAALVIWMN